MPTQRGKCQGMAKQVKTAVEAISVLGGPTAVARMLGIKNSRVVWNWRVRGLPPESFVALQAALKSKGFSAPTSLWRMYEAAE